MQNLLKKVMGSYVTGVSIVTTQLHNKDYGYTCNSLNAISLEPPIITFTVGQENYLYPFFSEAHYFSFSILTEQQENLSKLFSSRETMENRFSNTNTIRCNNHCLIIKNSLATIETVKESQHIVGDHLVIYAKITDGSVHAGNPLIYFRRNYSGIQLYKTENI